MRRKGAQLWWRQATREAGQRDSGATCNSKAPEPTTKTDEWYREEAIKWERGEASCFKGSHVFWKLPYWREAIMRLPDPMHTLGGEGRAIFKLLICQDLRTSVAKRTGEYQKMGGDRRAMVQPSAC